MRLYRGTPGCGAFRPYFEHSTVQMFSFLRARIRKYDVVCSLILNSTLQHQYGYILFHKSHTTQIYISTSR